MTQNRNPGILVVDDDEMIVDLIETYFCELGYDVTTATTAEDAINKLSNGKDIHLILTDIGLPGRSGLDLLKIIRENKGDIPVILLTGMKTLDTAISAVKSGATDFITKPFKLETIRQVVEKNLRKNERVRRKKQVYESLKYLNMNFSFYTYEFNPDILARELADILKKMRFASEEEIQQYEVVFSETFTNAMEHGNLELPSIAKNNDLLVRTEYEELREQRLNDPNYANRKIHITFECNPQLFSLTVKDDGPGFNWNKYLDRNHRITEVSTLPFGRGFNIVQLYIDEVHFNKTGNMITLIKNRN